MTSRVGLVQPQTVKIYIKEKHTLLDRQIVIGAEKQFPKQNPKHISNQNPKHKLPTHFFEANRK